MKKPYYYTDVQSTPLAFLKFLRVMLCISLFISGFQAIRILTEGDIFSAVLQLLLLAFGVVICVGLFKMKYYGVVCYFINILLNAIFYVINVFSDVNLAEDEKIVLGAMFLIVLVGLMIPIFIYFRKRRLLFSPLPRGVVLPPAEQAPAAGEAFTEDEPVNTWEYRYCVHCGGKHAIGDVYCPHCGKKLTE